MNTTLNQNRSFNLFIVTGIVITLVIVTGLAIASSTKVTGNVAPKISQDTAENANVALAPLSADAFPQYRQSERHFVAVTNVNGLQTYHQSERILIPAQTGLMAYQFSERTMTDAIASSDLSQYFASERTLVDPLAGLATYFESERTRIPIPFTQYQLSEWFGK